MLEAVAVTLDKRLTRALDRGRTDQARALSAAEAEREDEERRRTENDAWALRETREHLDEVFERIRAARAKGETEVAIGDTIRGIVPSALKRLVDAGEIEGLTATFASGYDYINSDEVREHWSHCVLRWGK